MGIRTIPKVHLFSDNSPRHVLSMQSESFGADGSTEPRLIGKTQPACVRDCTFLCATIQMSASTPANLDTGEGERS